ncbi:MAG: hypothetical protein KDA90_21795 [Planctomycetaceae bacterium]|nr:hypothetical protein [Planctomycetaceae bacterium]
MTPHELSAEAVTEQAATQPSQPSGKRTTYLLPDGRPDASVLQDRMPPHLQVSRAAIMLLAANGLIFTILSYLPIWHTDVWGHLAYGRWIVEHGVPQWEPLMPLSRGVSFIDTAWLSQVGGFALFQNFGTAGLQFASAASVAMVMGLLSCGVYRRTGNVWASLLTLFAFLAIDSRQLVFNLQMITRPQLAGMACFAIVFMLATAPRYRQWHTVAIALTFALWANLHGSFPVGLLVLGTLAVGRYVDFSWRARHALAGFRDATFRRLFVAAELGAVAVLLNPYGIGIYGEVFAVANNVNLRDLLEWEPLTMRMFQGQCAAIAAFVLACLYRVSPRRVTTGELLLLVGFGLLALWTSRMIVWWGPLAAYYMGLHTAAAWRAHVKHAPLPSRRAGLNTVVALGLSWIFFAYTPFGVRLLHGGPKTAEEAAQRFRKTVSRDTPVEITEWLVEHPQPGQIFNSYEWGDYLMWAGPQDAQLFVTSHVHLIPPEVWRDYRNTSYGLSGDWERQLDRYSVNTVIMDKMSHQGMIDALQKNEHWERAYEDRLGAVFVRRHPIE